MLRLNVAEYLEAPGLNVMLAQDYYPEGHQGGVGIILNGRRIATNGDLRLESSPGQWSPIPEVGERAIDREANEISVRMAFPDETKNRRGFNPIEYPDLEISYTLKVRPEGDGFLITVDLDAPLPDEWHGRVGLNLELFPGFFVGRGYAAGETTGVFPKQANGPGAIGPDGYEIMPLAAGAKIVIAPEDDSRRLCVETRDGSELQLIDGRGRHNNGWFLLRSLVASGKTAGAVAWRVVPNADPTFRSAPVVQVSQVGYHPRQPKFAVVELDARETARRDVELLRVRPEGGWSVVKCAAGTEWGKFLRYHYLRFDFTEVVDAGLYAVRYGDTLTSTFRIGEDIYRRHVWQPTVDTFLPVQMCHMRVVENYRVWHGACHLDDAVMAPVDHNHFDGYVQGPSTLSEFASGDRVPGLDHGGWHDAGDYDLRIESQADTVWGLSLAYEQFSLDYDDTTIDYERRLVELRKPDGKPDILQQVEHGVRWIVGAYRALGRLPRGVIEPTLEQYVHLGDAATHTDNIPSGDDRWVFTEENVGRELATAAALAAAARVLPSLEPSLASECLSVAQEIWVATASATASQRLAAAVELSLATGEAKYVEYLRSNPESLASQVDRHGWLLARSLQLVNDISYQATIRQALSELAARIADRENRTPYGVPYEPDIWGAGWGIQRFGFQQYWLHACLPDLFPARTMFQALNFVLGCHPGPNTVSFVSGVGAHSMIPGYGVNRADFSYIPGGVGSGTALIRPDYPELLEWPYLWQQTEYCLGSPTADYVFLVAATDHLLNSPLK